MITDPLNNITSQMCQSLPRHELSKWIEKCRKNPDNVELRTNLLQGLWNGLRFKEILDLLPPLAEDNLEMGLRLHSQVLMRWALSGTAKMKRLIPLAISYVAFLKEVERSALLGLLEELVQAQENKCLTRYYEEHLAIYKGVEEVLGAPGAVFNPAYLLSPIVAAELGGNLGATIFKLLADVGSPWSHYYQPGGHYLLWAAGDYLPEIETRRRQDLTLEINFQLDVVVSLRKSKSVADSLKQYHDFVAHTPAAQLFLAAQVAHYIGDTGGAGGGSERPAKERVKALTGLVDYLADLFGFIKKRGQPLAYQLNTSYLFTYFTMVTLDVASISLPKLKNALIEGYEYMARPNKHDECKELPHLIEHATTKFVKLCITKMDITNLNELFSKKAPSAALKKLCLDAAFGFVGESMCQSEPSAKAEAKTHFFSQLLACCENAPELMGHESGKTDDGED